MSVFVAEKKRFVVHLRPEDIADAVEDRFPLPALNDALRQLVEWGNLRADPDSSRVTTVEDYQRARFLYQLTERGEAVERALAAYDEHLGRRGALQSVALQDIAESLRVLSVQAQASPLDPATVSLTLGQLVRRFEDLADNAQAFMSSLQRTVDLYDADIETFRAYKDQLIGYLERFVKDLVVVGGEISGLLLALDPADVRRLLDAVAERDALDAAPSADGGDAHRAAADAAYAGWEQRWTGLRSWFVSTPRNPSQAKRLRAKARSAIPQLLAVVASLNERRSGRSDRTADLRTLARWFAQAPDEAAMHRLWSTAFGLAPSRHLSVDADTLEAREDRPVPPSTPWADAPPLRISARLRATGSYERRGRPNRLIDRAEARRELARRAAEEAAQTAAARRRLATAGAVSLGDLGVLDPRAFGLFLMLLGDALSARVPGQRVVRTTTSDGTLAVALRVIDDAPDVEIRTELGVLRGPDHLVEIVDLSAVLRPEHAA